MNFNIGSVGAKVGEAKQGCMDSISGIFIGFILFAVAFVPAWCSVKGVREYSEEVAALQLITAEQAANSEGLVKFSGDVEAYDDYSPIEFRPECGGTKSAVDVFWYEWELSEYTESTDSDGEVSGNWNTLDSGSDIIDSVTVDEIEVQPGSATTKFQNYESCEDGGIEQHGEQKLEVDWLPVEIVSNLTVVGEIHNGAVSSGDPFFISNLPPDQLVARLASEENVMRWILTGASILLFTIAFNLIIGPLLFLLKFVPVIGGGLRFFIFIGSLIIAIILVLLIKFVIMFWWLLILLMLGVVVLVVVGANKKKAAHAATPAAVPTSAPTRPETSQDVSQAPIPDGKGFGFCPSCGDPVSPGEKFCNNCGQKLE